MAGIADLSVVEATLAAALDAEELYLEADTGCGVIAACEVIARLRGRWGTRDAYSEQLDAWVQAHPQEPSAKLIALAVQAIDRVAEIKSSELAELWEDDDQWQAAVADLRERIA